MTYDNREDQFLRQRLQKEIPILRALIQNLYQKLDRKPEVSFKRSKNPDNFWI